MFEVKVKDVTLKQLDAIIKALPKSTWICVTPTATGGQEWKQKGKKKPQTLLQEHFS